MAWFFLTIAIVAELIGTLGLRAASDRPTWWVIALVLVSYLVSFTAMAVSLRHLRVGVVYAIWSAIGIAAISIAGWLLFGDRLRWPALIGLALIAIGVAVLVAFGGAVRS
jgi:small multidrug resistance pump